MLFMYPPINVCPRMLETRHICNAQFIHHTAIVSVYDTQYGIYEMPGFTGIAQRAADAAA